MQTEIILYLCGQLLHKSSNKFDYYAHLVTYNANLVYASRYGYRYDILLSNHQIQQLDSRYDDPDIHLYDALLHIL